MRNTLIKCTLLLSLSLLTACMHPKHLWQAGKQFTQEMKVIDNYQVERSNHWVLRPSTTFYVAQPRKVPHIDSASIPHGKALAKTVYQAFIKQFPFICLSKKSESYQKALRSARKLKLDYVIYPRYLTRHDKISTWEEFKIANDTELAEDLDVDLLLEVGHDSIQLELLILEASSGRLMDSALIDSQSGLLTFYGDQPSDLFMEPLIAYSERLRSE